MNKYKFRDYSLKESCEIPSNVNELPTFLTWHDDTVEISDNPCDYWKAGTPTSYKCEDLLRYWLDMPSDKEITRDYLDNHMNTVTHVANRFSLPVKTFVKLIFENYGIDDDESVVNIVNQYDNTDSDSLRKAKLLEIEKYINS